VKAFALVVLAGVAVVATAGALAIALGGPGDPAPLSSINDPFKGVDYSDLPRASTFAARDGAKLAFRVYAPAGGAAAGSVVLVHGSSARGSSMHVMARAFAQAGYAAYALDVRGHGDSGVRGRIAYVGQLEDDVEDFARAARLTRPATLVGFSSGGGFALRFAGSARQELFSSYLLLSPFISQDAPTYRPGSGGWVSVGLPRYVAIALLDAAGVRAFNHLPVTRFALNEEARRFMTPQYSFALAQNFRPMRDYRSNIRAVRQPLAVLAGRDDELFLAERFEAVFRDEGKNVPVTLLPGIDHVRLTLDPAALQAVIASVRRLNAPRL
jgi:alpha-beta hydrolase superfamily lysophospholipase